MMLRPEQVAAIEKDTRLPGEIASSYGVSIPAILQIQKRQHFAKRGRAMRAKEVSRRV